VEQENGSDPICFSPFLYRARNRIERFFNRIKQCRRVATRYDRLAANYLAFVQLASIRLRCGATQGSSRPLTISRRARRPTELETAARRRQKHLASPSLTQYWPRGVGPALLRLWSPASLIRRISPIRTRLLGLDRARAEATLDRGEDKLGGISKQGDRKVDAADLGHQYRRVPLFP
jgi:hypothetical protein